MRSTQCRLAGRRDRCLGLGNSGVGRAFAVDGGPLFDPSVEFCGRSFEFSGWDRDSGWF